MRRMLINAIHREESRVIISDNDILLDLEIERADQVQLKGNIYRALVSRVEPSLQAAFLDIGSSKNGFLQINDIHSAYFEEKNLGRNLSYRPVIQDVIRAGQELVVQVVKDERDAKGATLTTNLSIPGRYLVLMVGSQRGGVSRKIAEESQRKRLKHVLQELVIPAGMSVIVRTAGLTKTSAELQRDLDGLLEIWCEIVNKSLEVNVPNLLYSESSLAIRAVRDYLRNDFDEIWIDDADTFKQACDFADKIIPTFRSRFFYFDKPIPILSYFNLEAQVSAISHTEVPLPSGGSIVITPTEAVVAIDVNSGRSTANADVEETAFETNKEAAEVIARQLRLRDLGGLIVIDFIDMLDRQNRMIVERLLKDAVRGDRAKVEVGRISKFGLLEMSRQRIKGALITHSHSTCPNCKGRGLVRIADSSALEALRKVEAAVYGGGVKLVKLSLPPQSALFLLNEKRRSLTRLEEFGASVLVFADGRLKSEESELIMDTSLSNNSKASSINKSAVRSKTYQRNSAARESELPAGTRVRSRANHDNKYGNKRSHKELPKELGTSSHFPLNEQSNEPPRKEEKDGERTASRRGNYNRRRKEFLESGQIPKVNDEGSGN